MVCTSPRILTLVREALVDNGIALNDWRIEVRYAANYYQIILLEVTVYEPKHKKPSTVWEAPFDAFRQMLYWGDAKLLYSK